MEIWFSYALVSAVFAGLTAILAKVGIRKTDSNVVTAVRTVVVLIFAWIMVFVAGSADTVGNIGIRSFLFLILSGLATGASWLCYFKALQLGTVNRVAPIDKSSTILTMLLAFLFLGEELSVLKVVSMLMMFIGTMLMIGRLRQVDGGEKQNRTWFVYAVLSAIFASLTSILAKVGIEDVESNLGTAIRTSVVLIMAWVVVIVTRKQKQLKEISISDSIFICLSGISTGASWLCYYRALQLGPASVVVPIDKLSIVITIVFAFVFLHERLSLKAFLGLLLIVGGTLLLLV